MNNWRTKYTTHISSDELKEDLKSADVLLVPFEYRERWVFPVMTEECFSFLKKSLPELVIDICIDDEDYCELATGESLITLPSIVVSDTYSHLVMDAILDYQRHIVYTNQRTVPLKVSLTIEHEGNVDAKTKTT